MRMNCAFDARCGRIRLTTTRVRNPGTSPDSARYTSAIPPVARRPMIWYRPRRLTVSSPRDDPNSGREPPAIFPSKVQQLGHNGSRFDSVEEFFWRTTEVQNAHSATAPFMSSWLRGGPEPLLYSRHYLRFDHIERRLT